MRTALLLATLAIACATPALADGPWKVVMSDGRLGTMADPEVLVVPDWETATDSYSRMFGCLDVGLFTPHGHQPVEQRAWELVMGCYEFSGEPVRTTNDMRRRDEWIEYAETFLRKIRWTRSYHPTMTD